MTVPEGRIPVPFNMSQSLDTDSGRIRRELGYTESLSQEDGLRRTIEWERTQPGAEAPGIGLLDYVEEDAILAGESQA